MSRETVSTYKSKNLSSETDEDLTKRYEKIVRKLPTRSPIFLPTEKIPLEKRVSGVERVEEIYNDRLDRIYRPKLRALREKYKGQERCFVIGNGPSLNSTDLSALKDEVTFAVNGFFLKTDELNWKPTFYVVEDHLVAEDRAKWINPLTGSTKLFPVYLGYCLDEGEDTIFYNHQPRVSYPHGFDFSTKADEITYAGCTVTFSCLQLAFYLGFKKIYLIGVDASYDIPKDAETGSSYNIEVLDMKSDDVNHFHPDYFGKGFRWHDPQVHKMVEAYADARLVVDKSDQQILNATVGGKLEVFDRVPFASLFPHAKTPEELNATDSSKQNTADYYPKMLMFDITLAGDGTATGELKQSLMPDWPKERLLQFFYRGHDMIGCSFYPANKQPKLTNEDIIKLSEEFKPDLILYRPVPNVPGMHALAMQIIESLNVPLVTWIMDDWPTLHVHTGQEEKHAYLEKDFRKLLAHSALRLSIGKGMSDVFSQRYEVPFKEYANGVIPEEWPEKLCVKQPGETITVLYAGSLAENMTLDSIIDVARAIEDLAGDLNVEFKIKARKLWYDASKKHFKDFHHTSFITEMLSPKDYRALLQTADIVLIPYNFDETSLQYIQYSIANKMPECLASGAAILAVGPMKAATIGYVAEHDCAKIVANRDPAILKSALRELITSPETRNRLAQKARKMVFKRHNLMTIRTDLLADLTDASNSNRPFDSISLNDFVYQRAAHAHLDETALIAALYTDHTNRTMIDVGAHYGGSAHYFAPHGWRIACFEPDAKNRAHLVKKFGKNEKVTIDTRAVGENIDSGIPFYNSDESTGISGMLVFRDSHKQVSTVEVTTVEKIIKEQQLDHIDFLKIDVEGYDFGVLKGVPWDRMKPDMIECEFEDEKTKHLGHTWRDICDYLVERDYTVYVSEWHPIVRYGIRHDWMALKKYPCELEDQMAWGNLLAFKNDPGESAIARALTKVFKVENPEQKTELKVVAKPNGVFPPPRQQSRKMPQQQQNTTNTSAKVKPIPMDVNKSAAPTYQDPGLSNYARFALWLQTKSPALFRVGQFGMWILRAIKSRPLATLLALGTLAGLIAAPLFIAPLTPFSTWIWTIASALAVLAVMLLGIKYANNKMRHFAEKQFFARQGLRTELIREIKKKSDTDAGRQKQLTVQIGHLQKQLQESERVKTGLIAKVDNINTKAELFQTAMRALQQQGQNDHEMQKKMGSEILDVRDQLKNDLIGEREEHKKIAAKVQKLHDSLQEKMSNKDKVLEDQIVKVNADLKTQKQAETKLGAKLAGAVKHTKQFKNRFKTVQGEVVGFKKQVAALTAQIQSDQVAETLASLENQIVKVNADMEAQKQAGTQLGTMLEGTLKQNDQFKKQFEIVQSEATEFKTQITATAQLQSDHVAGTLTSLEDQIVKVNADMEAQKQAGTQLGTMLEGTLKQNDQFKKQFEIVQSEATEFKTQVTALEETSTQLSGLVDQKTDQLTKNIDKIASSAPVFNFGEFQHFNRKLTIEHIEILTREWARKLNFSATAKSLYYLAHRICTLESSMHGRLATTIEDAVLRTLVATSVRNNRLNVLEIGTLFGIGLAMIHDHARKRYENLHLTALDPLEGYYSKNASDVVTGEAIDEFNLRRNMAIAGIEEANYTLIKGMSTDDTSIKAAAQGGEYDVLIIDGDHSYAGVKTDFIQYLPFISRGGYIIFDDYGAPDWPGVKEFVDETVKDHPDVAFVGSSWRTAVFRVVQKARVGETETKIPLRQDEG